MESPLDILSRAAGMVSGSSTNSSPVPSDAAATTAAVVLVGGGQSSQVNLKDEGLPMRLVGCNNKRKFVEGRGGGSTSSVEDDVEGDARSGIPVMTMGSNSVILKKALVTSQPQNSPDGFGREEGLGGIGRSLPFFKSKVGPVAGSVMVKQRVGVEPFEDFEEDCQPLDMSCKKKRSSSPDNSPILPYQLPLRQAPPPPPQSSSSFNGVHHKKKWSAVLNNGDNCSNHSLKEGNINALGKIENNNGGTTTTSEGSGTDLRRPSVIYYATQTPGTENNNGIPSLPVGSSPANLSLMPSSGPLVVSSGGGGSGGGGGGGKARRRYLHHLHNQRHPSGSSSSSSSEMLPLPPRRKHIKRKKKQRDNLLGLSLGGLHNMTREELLDVESSQRRIVVITSKEDDIDEHFRRSLGDRYDKCYNKKEEETTGSHNSKPLVLSVNKAEASVPSPSSLSPTQIKSPPVTINNAAEATSHSNSPVNVKRDNSPPGAAADLDMSFSVDDHFAKALGSETWSRISKGSNSVKSEEVDEGAGGGPDSRRSSCSLSSLPEKA